MTASRKNGPTRTRKVITVRGCTAIVKECARIWGLPPQHFSCRSLRAAAVTTMKAAGASREVIHARTGHGPKSKVSSTHYDFSTSREEGGRGESVGPAALSELTTFTVENLIQQLPRSSLQRGAEGAQEGKERESKKRKKKGVQGETKSVKEGIPAVIGDTQGRGKRKKTPTRVLSYDRLSEPSDSL